MILVILQARCSSSRLPGKVLKPLLGQPMLLRQLERVSRAQRIDRTVVATSDEASDDALYELCRQNDVDVFRGSLDDVLDRYYQCAELYDATHIVRVTGDCPLIDPAVIDAVIEHYLAGSFDYCSNAVDRSYPDGLDVEVFGRPTLERAWKEATLPAEREHVTPYIHGNPDKFACGSLVLPVDWSGLRWTVDEPADFEFVERVYSELYESNKDFSMHDVLALLSREPALQEINAGFRHDEAMLRAMLANYEERRV